jgi:hypothetical protein
MIQVRDVPDRLHGTLKSRAAKEGMSLSDFIKRELERVAEKPTLTRVAGADSSSQTNSDQGNSSAGDSQTTRPFMIVLDASVVVELLLGGA